MENRILSYLWLASVVVGVSVLSVVVVVVEFQLLQSGVYSSQYQ